MVPQLNSLEAFLTSSAKAPKIVIDLQATFVSYLRVFKTLEVLYVLHTCSESTKRTLRTHSASKELESIFVACCTKVTRLARNTTYELVRSRWFSALSEGFSTLSERFSTLSVLTCVRSRSTELGTKSRANLVRSVHRIRYK